MSRAGAAGEGRGHSHERGTRGFFFVNFYFFTSLPNLSKNEPGAVVSRGMPFQPGSRRAPLSLQGAHTHMLRVVGRGNDFVLTQHDARIIITILYTRATVASRHRKHLTSQAPHSRNFPDLPEPEPSAAEP